MASLERRSERFRIVFRFAGRKFQHALKTSKEGEARSCLARLEENLRLLERGRLVLPPAADLPTFLLSDGQPGSIQPGCILPGWTCAIPMVREAAFAA
jgi:hypothetical protein